MKVRRLVQGLFLVLFIFLISQGKQQLWMFVFLVSVLGALFWGRFYCAWLCPINTTIDVVDKIYQKLGIKRREVPVWVKKPWVRRTMMGLFLLTMVFVLATGHKVPVLLVLTILGVVLSLFFAPAMWHRYLCPYGSILGLTGARARHFYFVDQQDCVRCGKCKKVCPAEAIVMEDKKDYPWIDKALCLECSECVEICLRDTIRYGRQGLLP